jgi:hypothetical protein
MMWDKKLHWYMLSYLKVNADGSGWGVSNTYIGREKQRVTKIDILSGAEFIACDWELTLQSVSYLGYMSEKEFDGE